MARLVSALYMYSIVSLLHTKSSKLKEYSYPICAHFHDGSKDAFQKKLAHQLARRKERQASRHQSRSPKKKKPDPKKKPDSKKKKHDPLAGTLIKQHKHSKTDPFAGMKRKKRKQKEAP